MTILLDRQEVEVKVGLVDGDRVDELLAPLERLAGVSPHLQARPLPTQLPHRPAGLPAYRFLGPGGGGDPVRIGIFGGIHGDEPASARAAVRFLEELDAAPDLARGYAVFVYPVCNPSGFLDGTRCARSGRDLNREFWRESSEPEVAALEAEIRARRFHGLISLHADDTSAGVYGYVRGAVLARALLEPALGAAAGVLPLNTATVIDGFPAENGIISQCYEGILTSPPAAQLDPEPFEIILETPHAAPLERQERALVAAMSTVLEEYQKVLAFAANL